ncbi:hypothetical protein ACPV5T_10495 [Vibrio astriarenae]
MILKRIEQVLELNSLAYEIGGNVIYCKLGGGANEIKIRYQASDNTFRLNYGFWNQVVVFFCTATAFMTLNLILPDWNSHWLVLLLMITGINTLVVLVITEIRLLDLKIQLREVGVYLTPESQFKFSKNKIRN